MDEVRKERREQHQRKMRELGLMFVLLMSGVALGWIIGGL